MRLHLVKFETVFLLRKPITWIGLTVFFAVGFLMGSLKNLPFPGIHRNSPYLLTYFIGIASLGTIFTVTISVAQSLLKDRLANFESILFVTPIRKFDYLFSQLAGLLTLTCMCLCLNALGVFAGNYMPWLPAAERGTFTFAGYLWPLVVLAVPNVLLCVSVTACIAWLTRSVIGVYAGGLLIYILYIAGSILSNSPIIAGASPASAEEMSLVAKLDPFGLAAFFEQTRYWTIYDRNTVPVQLRDNLLFNRICWFSISILILAFSYFRFSFRKLRSLQTKKAVIPDESREPAGAYTAVEVIHHKMGYHFRTVGALVKMDLQIVIKGVPFLVIILMLSAFLLFELSNEVNAGVRLAQHYANTALMITVLLSALPLMAALVLLFYSNELLWKSSNLGFTAIQTTNPVPNYLFYAGKLLTLAVIIVFLLGWSICMAIIVQLLYHCPVIDGGLYASLFYYLGLPLLFLSAMLLFIQNCNSNKYLALVSGALFILLFNSNIGYAIGVQHTLIRFANTLATPYWKMNGFGEYATAFHWQVINEGAISIAVALGTVLTWNRNHLTNGFAGFKKVRLSRLQMYIICGALVVAFISGAFIYFQSDVKFPVLSAREKFDWRESYERNYKKFRESPQPSVRVVKANVDLFPKQHRYTINGSYLLLNKTANKIDSLLLYVDPNAACGNIEVPHATMLLDDARFHHRLYRLSKPLLSNDSLIISYSLSSTWSPFGQHTPFNSIINNGSFIRMSKYFPRFGYQADNEIDNITEREKRNLGRPEPLRKADAAEKDPYTFIDLDVVVSTDGDQTAIGSGELISHWKQQERNYFHYKTSSPIPFRFAFASARYELKKAFYKDIAIEVYFDAGHSNNVDRLLKNAQETLEYAENNFGPYPYGSIRFAEISSFATGFAATAYPSVIFMKEDLGFDADLRKPGELDVINQLAGHELSHTWWGVARLSPDQREGYGMMTETLAQYTELMLYKKMHGLQKAIDLVKMHVDLYLAGRGYQKEMPLYRVDLESPHVIYDKGFVVMHQLEQLIGEANVNKALKHFFQRHRYPYPSPVSSDLVHSIYLYTPAALHSKIDELFKEVVTYDAKLQGVSYKKLGDKNYEITIAGSLRKFNNTTGNEVMELPAGSTIEAGVKGASGKLYIFTLPVVQNKIASKITIAEKPSLVTLDPLIKNIDQFISDNEKEVNE